MKTIEITDRTSTPNDLVNETQKDALLLHSTESGAFLLSLGDELQEDPQSLYDFVESLGYAQLAHFSPGISYDWNACARIASIVDAPEVE